MKCIRFEVPTRTASTANLREHWAAKHKRVDAQKAATRRRCPEWEAGPLLIVTLTRLAPRRLDDDNLRGALKSVRDAIATWLRVDDRSPLVAWHYAQEQVTQKKGKPPVDRVRVEVVPALPPKEADWMRPVGEMAPAERARREAEGIRIAEADVARGLGRDLLALAKPAVRAPSLREGSTVQPKLKLPSNSVCVACAAGAHGVAGMGPNCGCPCHSEEVRP